MHHSSCMFTAHDTNITCGYSFAAAKPRGIKNNKVQRTHSTIHSRHNARTAQGAAQRTTQDAYLAQRYMYSIRICVTTVFACCWFDRLHDSSKNPEKNVSAKSNRKKYNHNNLLWTTKANIKTMARVEFDRYVHMIFVTHRLCLLLVWQAAQPQNRFNEKYRCDEGQ